jgi:hypothetical protein
MRNRVTVAKEISEQLSRMLLARAGQGQVLKHNLEKGLGNEQCLRDLLCDVLPRRYGVAKGKIANAEGRMSRQLDVIIYDAVYCPSLFVDENRNQMLPIEGVYGVVEVKTTLTSALMAKAFQNLASVYALMKRINISQNEMVTACPPFLELFAFRDERSLDDIARQFAKLSEKYHVERSCYSYSEKSPGHAAHTGKSYLVCSINILGKGCVYHMLDGSIAVGDFGEYTLGMFLTSLIKHLDALELKKVDFLEYLNWLMVQEWRGSVQARRIIRRSSRAFRTEPSRTPLCQHE